ncbi:MAG: helix-turn-helix domain-containing protein [Chitinophagaceae bacterium]
MEITRFRENSRGAQRCTRFDMYVLDTYLTDTRDRDQGNLSHMHHSFLWIKSGRGGIDIDLEHYSVEDETLYYVRPGQSMHAFLQEPAKGFLISFEQGFLNLVDKDPSWLYSYSQPYQFRIPAMIQIRDEITSSFESIIVKMFHEYQNYYNLRTEIISSFLKVLIIYLSRQTGTMKQETVKCTRSEYTSAFFSLLEKHFTDKKMVKDYAGCLSLTSSYLNKVVKQTTGFSASYHIQQRILLEAKRLLIHGNNNLKEIAYTLGFCDPSHFSKFFKSGVGTNFMSFKKTALNIC